MMALSVNFDDQLATTTDTNDSSASNWDHLYCTHLWANSNLRRAVIDAAHTDNRVMKYCYTCRGKIRKYEIKSPKQEFVPTTHSTPNSKVTTDEQNNEPLTASSQKYHHTVPTRTQFSAAQDVVSNSHESDKTIPTISRQIDSSFRQKYTSYEMRPGGLNQRRLRKSMKGIGCIINLALIDSPVKKRTQIQACSISVMIIAIVVISFILVNFTSPSFTIANNVTSTIVVPTETIHSSKTSSNMPKYNTSLEKLNIADQATVTEPFSANGNKNISILNNNSIETITLDETNLAKLSSKSESETSTNLPPSFCSCQTNEICMLETTTGKGICRKPLDSDDPTGCGGLCALNTEACREIDKVTGVKYCMSLLGPTTLCSEEEWQCRNSRCVSAEARCNGTPQCYDKSDEMNCECDLTKNFRCGHSMSCLPNAKRCDRIVDCWDGFDEINCTAVCPNEDQFTCNMGQCIELSLFCDGLADCADGSDEPHGCGGPCLAHEMHCANGRCIPKSRRCDGHDDCGDMSDEFFCSHSVSDAPT